VRLSREIGRHVTFDEVIAALHQVQPPAANGKREWRVVAPAADETGAKGPSSPHQKSPPGGSPRGALSGNLGAYGDIL